MYSGYLYNKQLEDDLYKEDDSEGSEPDSELEFHLYSQLHYSSNTAEVSELEDKGKEVNEGAQHDQNMSGACVLGQLSENKSLAHKTGMEQVEEKKKRTEMKKGKEKPRSQRISSLFEEVIVIDSSPDVITLSEEDSSDEKEGVCALKGQRLPKLCTSTPAQEGRKRVNYAAPPVSVSSSDSDNESESELASDSSASSASEDVENWMILGNCQQEGDQSISLNLDGVAEGDTDVEELGGVWLISDKDIQAQITNKDRREQAFRQKMTSRYYTDKNVHCRNCDKVGHLSKNCPESKKETPCSLCSKFGHKPVECDFKHCSNCGLPGHLYLSCSERPYRYMQCHRCGMTGHNFDACPEIWRQYHLTIEPGPPLKHQGQNRGRTPPYCHNCGKKGHFGHECPRPRMFNGICPNTPFINHYDTIEDIKCRQHRTKLKAQNLKSNGFFPPFPQSPSTSGPPRKKQKISHKKNSHLHMPHQSFKSDLPAAKHIFFGEKTSKKHKRSLQVVSLEKPWKPKRPVPQSRHPAPNAVVVLEDDDDFPRGGGQSGEVERKKRKKKNKKGQPSHWTRTGKQGFSPEDVTHKNENWRKKKNAKKNARKNSIDKSCPTDENLFIIKQRKHKRS